MNALQASVLALALAFAGMVALAFAMERHHEQLTGAMEISRARSRLLRCAGALLLAVAVMPCLRAWGFSVGVVVWLGWLSIGALLAVALISAAARWAAAAGCIVAAAALAWVWRV
ncbi:MULTISPECIES: DUF3325 domain-containing protein [Comamonas]|uniref:DUF3325 domain-containing protein n=1 Tax=Comamonas TaxID=283 RepID=UPI0006B9C183|nr:MULTISPECIES: DUF3325 domain-containing protein [Comamonas]QOQ84179.1 DUF3325 domain-containing protein [Comamonas thiooxydans]BDB69631.1 hypothetical protein Cthiooxydans_20430 [Comamonas thiooxydans]